MCIRYVITIGQNMKKNLNYSIYHSIGQFLYLLGYVSLIGPSRIIEIQNQARVEKNELTDGSLFYILVSETAVRAGLFLLIAGLVEISLGDKLFEMYQLDYLFALLILAGIVHVLAYYVGIVFFAPKYFRAAMIIYRLGRNLAYALLPAILAVGIVLLLQDQEQIELFSGELIKQSFIYSYILFSVIGMLESILKTGKPLCLGDIKKSERKYYDT